MHIKKLVRHIQEIILITTQRMELFVLSFVIHDIHVLKTLMERNIFFRVHLNVMLQND